MAFNLTTVQIITGLKRTMDFSNLNVSKAVSICSILMSMYGEQNPDEMKWSAEDLTALGFINSQGMIPSISFFDDAVSAAVNVSSPIVITYDHPSYSEEVPATIMGCLTTSTLKEAFSTPIMDKVFEAGYSSIRDAAIGVYISNNFIQIDTESWRMIIRYNGTEYVLGTFTKLQDDRYLFTWNDDEDFEKIGEILRFVLTAGTGVSLTTEGLSTLINVIASGCISISDIRSCMDKYLNSNLSVVSSFFRNLFSEAGATLDSICAKVIDLFRHSREYYVDDDGKLHWSNHGQLINTSITVCIGSVLSQIGTIIGTVLMYSGHVALQIIGGAAFVLGSVFSVLTQGVADVAGTIPNINPDVGDYTYSDCIASEDDVEMPDDFDWDTDLGEDLLTKGRAKIVVPFGILYMYNCECKIIGSKRHATVSYKIFPNLVGYCDFIKYKDPDGKLYLAKWLGFDIWHWPEAQLNIAAVETTTNCNYAGRVNGFMETVYNNWVNVNSGYLHSRSADANYWQNLWGLLNTNCLLCTLFMRSKKYIVSQNYSPNGSSDHDFTEDYTMITRYCGGNACSYDYRGVHNYANLVNIIAQYSTHAGEGTGILGRNGPLPLYGWLYNLGYVKGTNRTQYHNYHGYQWNPDYNGGEIPTWDDKFAAVVDFIVPDKYAYVTPPSADLRTILYSAAVGTLLVAIVAVGFVVARKAIAKKVEASMQRKGAQLLEKGKVFQKPFTDAEWKQLSSSDRAEYLKAYKWYKFQVGVYNVIASTLGLGTLDWMNSWWNSPTSVIPNPQPESSTTLDDVAERLSQNTELNNSTGLPQTINPIAVQNGEQQITIVDLYNAITGLLNSGNPT